MPNKINLKHCKAFRYIIPMPVKHSFPYLSPYRPYSIQYTKPMTFFSYLENPFVITSKIMRWHYRPNAHMPYYPYPCIVQIPDKMWTCTSRRLAGKLKFVKWKSGVCGNTAEGTPRVWGVSRQDLRRVAQDMQSHRRNLHDDQYSIY